MRRIAWLFLAACGSGSSGTTPHHPEGSGSGATPHAEADRPSERECDELVEHVLALQLATRKDKPTDAELAQLRGELHGDPACAKLSRERLRCAMGATTNAEYQACQTTRSSSTSNSSVAPGGMTPPAPRSP